MTLKADRREFAYEQVVELALGMSTKDQLKLAEELRRSGLKAKWDDILAAFQPNSISEREIVRTCKEVRSKLWEKRRHAVAARRR